MDTKYTKYEPIFGSWYIKDIIGHGSAGEVLLIEREDLGETYRSALKCITIPQNEDEVRSIRSNGMTNEEVNNYYTSYMNKIKRELSNMAKLKGNSNIVSYEDHLIVPLKDTIGWDILIRMELLKPLLEYCEEHPLDEKEVLKLGIDMCKALELCGKNGIIHRDIKPENIFISPNGDFKLGDFGVSRTIEETKIGLSRKGTYTYMAPEVYKGEPYGMRSDVYSLGLVLYKYLNNGRNAFLPGPDEPLVYQDNDRAFFRRMSGAILPPPMNGSDKFKEIVLKACAYVPGERFADASELREQLELLCDECDAKITKITKQQNKHQDEENAYTETTSKPSGRKKVFILLAAAVVLVAALIVYIAIPKEITDIKGISEKENIYAGDTKSFEYVIEPSWFEDEKISFESTDERVLKVNGKGQLTGIKPGKAVVGLTAHGFNKKVDVSVDPKVTDIVGVKTKLTLEMGDTYKLKPRLLPKKFADEPVSYSSSKSSVAKVSKKGKITAKKAGKAVIKISAGYRTEKMKVTVNEPPVEEPVVQETAPRSSYSYSQPSSGSSGNSGSSSSGASKSNSSSKSKSNSSNKNKESSGGYFDSSDDEYF